MKKLGGNDLFVEKQKKEISNKIFRDVFSNTSDLFEEEYSFLLLLVMKVLKK
jgi:hypothetical protein